MLRGAGYDRYPAAAIAASTPGPPFSGVDSMMTRHGRSERTVSSVRSKSVAPARGTSVMTIARARISRASSTSARPACPARTFSPCPARPAPPAAVLPPPPRPPPPADQLGLLDDRVGRGLALAHLRGDRR